MTDRTHRMNALKPTSLSSKEIMLDAALLRAYAETDYCVWKDRTDALAFVLKVAEVSRPLAELHKESGVACSAFITACNPLGQAFTGAANEARQRALQDVLKQRSLRWLGGIGQHPSNQWPGEPSVLVLGLSLATAKVLAGDFEQNAFIWSGHDAKPQLVLLR
jgi:Protein of unknown function (DUF3293)